MRIAYYSPLQPATAWDQVVLPELASEAEVERFVEAGTEAPAALAVPTWEESAFPQRHQESPYDLVLYRLDDHPTYRFIWEALHARPGAAILHSLHLHHLFAQQPVEPAYEQALAEAYDEAGRAMARTRTLGLGSPLDEATFPLGWLAATRSLGVVVHTQAAHDALRRRVPALPTARIGQPLPAPTDEADAAAIRQRLGLRPQGLVITSFGLVALDQRCCIATVYGRLLQEDPALTLIVAAESPEDAELWQNVLRTERLWGAARILEPGASPAAWAELAAVSDIGLTLRPPALGEVPDWILRLLSHGKAILLPAGQGPPDFPEDCCAYLDRGPAEGDMLRAYLQFLCSRPDVRQRLGENAQAYVRSAHDPRTVARSYLRFLKGLHKDLQRRPAALVPPPEWRPRAGSERLDIEEILAEIRQRIGETYAEGYPFPTFSAYRSPPSAQRPEDNDLFQAMGEINRTWTLPSPPAQGPEHPTPVRLGELTTYIAQLVQQQTLHNASVVRCTNRLQEKVFDPAREAELTALRYELAALYQRVAELEKRLAGQG